MLMVFRILRRRGPVWNAAKRVALWLLTMHLPVNRLTRPFFSACYGLHVFVREVLIWCCRFFWYEPLFRSQCRSIGRGFRMESLPYITGRGEIRIGDSVRLSGKPSLAFNNRYLEAPELAIGDGTFIGHDCSFTAGKSIRIGNHCLLAGGVRVSDQDGHPLNAEERRAGQPTPWADVHPVVIGDDVWIGAGAVVLKGVTIGDRAIIGTRAVVTKDVPADSVFAGNPGRVVKRLDAGPGKAGPDSAGPEKARLDSAGSDSTGPDSTGPDNGAAAVET